MLWSKLYVQHHTPVFSVTWSSEIIYADLLLNQIIINAENSRAAEYFYGIHDAVFFLGYLWIEYNLFEIEIVCHLW